MSTDSEALKALVVRPFTSVEEATRAVLEVAVQALGMDSTFLTRADVERGLLEVVASHNRNPGFVIPPGLRLPLEESP